MPALSLKAIPCHTFGTQLHTDMVWGYRKKGIYCFLECSSIYGFGQIRRTKMNIKPFFFTIFMFLSIGKTTSCKVPLSQKLEWFAFCQGMGSRYQLQPHSFMEKCFVRPCCASQSENFHCCLNQHWSSLQFLCLWSARVYDDGSVLLEHTGLEVRETLDRFQKKDEYLNVPKGSYNIYNTICFLPEMHLISLDWLGSCKT